MHDEYDHLRESADRQRMTDAEVNQYSNSDAGVRLRGLAEILAAQIPPDLSSGIPQIDLVHAYGGIITGCILAYLHPEFIGMVVKELPDTLIEQNREFIDIVMDAQIVEIKGEG